MPMPGETILRKGGDQGLRSYLCFCIKARDIGLKKATWRSYEGSGLRSLAGIGGMISMRMERLG
jgi:hypothetical protein